ncbi:MAG: DUF3368 domain-containing protein [Candidatus Brockarchaeota archaeon]|nr:DUF3368 domain-containing protein [Candidatus Brockarchaeota archaeon]
MGKGFAGGSGGGNPSSETGSDLKFVLNSSPLIHLVKAGLAWMIGRLEGEKYITPSVYAEVVETGKAKGFDDALITEELLRRGAILIKKPSGNLLKLISAHKDIRFGEAEVISLAKELDGIAVIDDPVARSVAELHGVKKEGSYMIILRTLRRNEIKKDEAKEALKSLIESGWRCNVELYSKVLDLIENF